MSEKAAYYVSQQAEVVEYLSHYFVKSTTDFLIQRYDLRNLNFLDISVGHTEIEWMQSSGKITEHEANTLRMIITTRKINHLLQELNKTY